MIERMEDIKMTVYHKKCNAEIKGTHPITGKHSTGDWGYCQKCGERVDHLIFDEYSQVKISNEVEIIWDGFK